jgi:hypothetical protein
MQTADKRRYDEQAKGADRLEPKGKVMGMGVSSFPHRRHKHHR